jgi:Uma2 family endonuclease
MTPIKTPLAEQPAEQPLVKEQRLVLPGYHSWSQLQALQSLLTTTPGVRITYIDGWVELMTLGEAHETLKTIIGALIELYFLQKRIEFIPVGSATRESEERGISFEPDESYYIGTKKAHPDLAVEINLTSGSIQKLSKYARFQVKEVWFWENNCLSLYAFHETDYRPIRCSELLPELDLDLLTRCVQMSSKLEAMTTFMTALNQ